MPTKKEIEADLKVVSAELKKWKIFAEAHKLRESEGTPLDLTFEKYGYTFNDFLLDKPKKVK